jgi:hypothetical protein
MPDLVVSPFVFVGLAVPGLIDLTLKLLRRWKDFIVSMKTAEKNAELLSTRFEQLTRRYSSLQDVLFGENKFKFVDGRVFDHLPADQQLILRAMFRELARLLYACYCLESSRNVNLVRSSNEDVAQDITLSPEELAELFSEGAFEPKHGSTRIRMSWRNFTWAVSTKKRVEELIDKYEEWQKRIRETLEDFWWPLSFFDKFTNLQSLELDEDCRTVGIIDHSSLRKLLVPDAPLQPDLEFRSSLGPMENTSVPLRKRSQLGEKRVLVEIMPFQADRDGFMPEVLRRRFCTIAALLHAQSHSDFGVLPCLHWGEDQQYDGSVSKTSFQLVSAFPSASFLEFKTLAEVIKSWRGSHKPSLDCRLQICYILARTLSLCHSVGWLHRNVRSSNVLFFFQDQEGMARDAAVLEAPKLCGFEESRLQDDFSTAQYGDNSIESNIYRHPDRWGTPRARFDVYHDLYGT